MNIKKKVFSMLVLLIFFSTSVSLLLAQTGKKKSDSAPQKQEQAKADDKDMMDLANSKGCLACHQLDKKLIGPAWLEVSNKYDQKDVDYLVNKIIQGGVGVWGNIPMPPNRGIVTEEEARKLANWIITLKSKKK